MIRLIITHLVALQISSMADIPLDEAKRNGMWETLQTYIKHNEVIADICVYEQAWIPPSKPSSKGQLIQRAVITHVHSGSWRVRQQIEYTYHMEDAPRFFGPLAQINVALLAQGYTVKRIEFEKFTINKKKKATPFLAFIWLIVEPIVNGEAQQDGRGQPSTRPESDSESSDKPQPEAEGCSR